MTDLRNSQTYRCCSCCDSGVDPDLHAEEGRDFHSLNCTSCDGNADLKVVEERDAALAEADRLRGWLQVADGKKVAAQNAQREAEHKLNAVTEVTDEVRALWGDVIGTHYAGCWKRHVQCLAVLVGRTLQEEVTPSSSPASPNSSPPS